MSISPKETLCTGESGYWQNSQTVFVRLLFSVFAPSHLKSLPKDLTAAESARIFTHKFTKVTFLVWLSSKMSCIHFLWHLLYWVRFWFSPIYLFIIFSLLYFITVFVYFIDSIISLSSFLLVTISLKLFLPLSVIYKSLGMAKKTKWFQLQLQIETWHTDLTVVTPI